MSRRLLPPPGPPPAAAAAGSAHAVLSAANPVAEARAVIRELHLGVGAAVGLVDDAVLVTSELVTNAVVHGRSPYELLAQATRRWVRVEVHDRSPAVPAPRAPGRDDEHGRGLRIVAALATRWGSARTERGKVVWAEVGTSEPERPTAARAC